ncbi:LPXTG-domain-containing protein [Metarhizium rileyi]|uniref:LPXTG-domain-containing protein n=1 Tax=Metarhizium rileyi (strain RCEF 4871) TaxID=1649241 RepID=A0A167BQ62_METRR|nr:LPXTG-domain-containing protein [Metarhizium rileyi RCEF 4871]
MASTSRIRTLLLVTSSLAIPAAALQVTPDSPCSSACIDAPGLDTIYTNASSTPGADVVVCPDSQFDTNAAGARVKTCLTCLQSSTYVQGSEGDQAWFIYHLRYAFDYCIFGHPNAVDARSSPCATPKICGSLRNALQDGITKPNDVQTYGYCSVDGDAVTGTAHESCLQCRPSVKPPSSNKIPVLIALKAGCQQKPPASHRIGVNETVFTHHSILTTQASPSQPSTSPLSTPAVVGIAVAAAVLLALVSGCAYIQLRRRQDRINRSRRTLSFRCRAPSPTQYQDDYDDERFFDKRSSQDVAVAVASMSPVARSKPYPWAQSLGHTLRTSTSAPPPPLNISTSISCPEPALTSPRGGGSSPDSFTAPTSTVSTRSTAPLLLRGSVAPSPVDSPTMTSQQGDPGRWESAGRKRPTPGSPAHLTRIQTTFDPPPTR